MTKTASELREEPEEDPQWGSDEGDDQDGTSAPQEQW